MGMMQRRGSTPGTRAPWEAFFALLALILLYSGSALAQSTHQPAPESVDGWMVIGDFSGSADLGLVSRLSNWFFEYERGDSLYQDMGDLGIGLGGDSGNFSWKLDWFFRRRVARSQELKPRGATITADDISYFSNINTSRIRLRTNWDYLRDANDIAGVGVEVEGGFSVTMARKRQPLFFTDDTDPTDILSSPLEEFKEFFVEEDVNLKENDVVYVTVGSMAAVVDGAAAAVGNRLANTEQAAIYWDEYSRPMMLFPRTGIPVRLRVFTGDDPTLAIGDSLTFLTFVGLSPLNARVDKAGARVGWKRYLRLLRETTILKEPDDIVLVRVRDWRGNGNELQPFKYRPGVKLWIFRLSYTFFESIIDRFREKVSDTTYRIDLETEAGMEKFRQLLKQGGRTRITPQLAEFPEEEGVEVLYSETESGRTHNARLRANLFSLFEYRRQQLGSTRRIVTREAELREITRGRLKRYRNRITQKRQANLRSVITVQSDLEWYAAPGAEGSPTDERLAVTVNSNVSLDFASEEEIRTLARTVQEILGLSQPHPVLSELQEREVEGRTKLRLDLMVSFGPREIARFGEVTEDDIWRAMAALLLGSEHESAWATSTDRHWWEPGAKPYSGPEPSVRHIGIYYDRLRGYEKPSGNDRFFTPDHTRSQRLFKMARKAVRKFKKLQIVFGEDQDCLQCLIDGYASQLDVYLIQALAVKFAGGVEGGGVGFDFKFLVGDMTRPAGASNDVVHGYHIDSAHLVQNTETIRDSPPRLRKGQAWLNVSGPEAESRGTEASCWRLRVFSDYLFADDLRLRMYGRMSWKRKKDVRVSTNLVPLGEPRSVEELPGVEKLGELVFSRQRNSLTSEYGVGRNVSETLGGSDSWAIDLDLPRYFYDVPLPALVGASENVNYTVLLRVVNSTGLPVTEEQEIRLRLPENWRELVPEPCLAGEMVAETTSP